MKKTKPNQENGPLLKAPWRGNSHCYIYYMHGEGDGTPLQDSCLENPMDGGAW